jgi:hypothetical protein
MCVPFYTQIFLILYEEVLWQGEEKSAATLQYVGEESTGVVLHLAAN